MMHDGAHAAPFEDDPVARRTEWKPLARGGSNYRSHRLVDGFPSRLAFQMSAQSWVFVVLFGLISVGVPSFMIHGFIQEKGPEESLPDVIVMTLVMLLFCTLTVVLYLSLASRGIFDLRARLYMYSPALGDKSTRNRARARKGVPFDQIHALQIVSEYVRRQKRSYYSHELNLVLESGERLNVVDHGDLEALRRDAATLARHLECPVWDASESTR